MSSKDDHRPHGLSFEYVDEVLTFLVELQGVHAQLHNEIGAKADALRRALALLRELEAPYLLLEDTAEQINNSLKAEATFVWGRGPGCDWSLVSSSRSTANSREVDEFLTSAFPRALLVAQKPVPRNYGLAALSNLAGTPVTESLWAPISHNHGGVLGAIVAVTSDQKGSGFAPRDRHTIKEAALRLVDRLASRLFDGLPVEFPSCLISYSHHDRLFVEKLAARFAEEGVSIWVDARAMMEGQLISEQLNQALENTDRVILVISEHSMASEWVKSEVRKVLQREKRSRRYILFPVRLVELELIRRWGFLSGTISREVDNLAKRILDRHILDFMNWEQPEVFESRFRRAMIAIRAMGQVE